MHDARKKAVRGRHGHVCRRDYKDNEMRINRIALNGFRNYDFETADFSPGTNVIYGENAQGKTNLLESVYMLAMGRSFRTRFDRELIGFGCDSAEILADVVSHEREQTVRILLRSGVRKQITVNSVKKPRRSWAKR